MDTNTWNIQTSHWEEIQWPKRNSTGNKGMNECGIRKLSEPKRPANFCGGLLRSLLAPRN